MRRATRESSISLASAAEQQTGRRQQGRLLHHSSPGPARATCIGGPPLVAERSKRPPPKLIEPPWSGVRSCDGSKLKLVPRAAQVESDSNLKDARCSTFIV